jgi:TonB family protein
MAITVIPPGPPERRPQGGYSSDTESLHDVPVLVIQLQDDLARSRMREAFWISVVVHLVVVMVVIASPKLFPSKNFIVVGPTPEELMHEKDATFLELPPDVQKITQPPRTNIMSDKNRIAMSRNPTPQQPEPLRDVRPPGAPGAAGPRTQQPGAPQVAQASPPAGNQGGSPPPQQAVNTPQPKLESPPQPVRGFGGAMSPGSAIEQAARAAASRGGGGQGGDFGLGQQGQGQVKGNMEVLSDTMGVDFGPYLARVLHDVRQNWYNLIPEVARPPLMKKGKVSIQFAIMKDGRVAGMQLVGGSGDVSLDRAAWGGITASNPFPPLPTEFKGNYLALRFHFYYNPDKNDLE